MKIKTFILTFLMMMSSPFLFGQQHWVPDELYHSGTMQFTSQIYLDGELQTNTDYEVAAFHGNELLAVSKILVIGEAPNQLFHVDLNVKGKDDFGKIYFKLFDGSKEYVSEEEIQFVNQSENGGNHITPTEINFKSVAQIEGTEFDVVYPTIEEAIAAAQKDETVTILAGEYTQDLDINKAITVQGERNDQDENLVNITGKLNITANNATAKNLNVNSGSSTGYINAKDVTVDGCTVVGGNGFRNCYTTGTVTFKNSIITGNTYGIHFDGSAGGNIVIEKCDITGWTSFASTITNVAITDTDFLNGNYNVLRFYQDATVTGVTFPAGMRIDTGSNGTGMEGIEVKFNGCSIEGGNLEDAFPGSVIAKSDIYVNNVLLKREAKIGNTYYETLAEAIAAVGDGDVVIELLADVTFDYNARDAYGKPGTTSLTINGNGKTLTLNQKNSDWSSFGLANADAKVVFNNMTIEKTGYGDTSGAWNTHTIIFSSNVEMTDVTVNNSMAVQNGATLNNVTINEANGYYGLWINGNGQSVTMNGGSINATNGGRGIKIADQYVGAPALVTLSVTGTTFNTAKKAAVLVSSKAGAAIAASNVDITNVAEDKVNFAWVDEDWAAHYGKVTVTGGTLGQENLSAFAAALMNGEKVEGYYETLPEAVAAAQDGNTITMLQDDNVTETVKVNNNITLNLNGKTVTANCKKAFEVYANATIKNGTINSQSRCVDTRTNVVLTLTDVNLNAPEYKVENPQPLTVGGSDNGTEIVMTNVNINAGTTGYAIISFVKTDLTATNSNMSGFSALYVKPGSEYSKFNFVESTLKGDIPNDVEDNSFATIVTEEKNVTVTLDANSKLVSVGQNYHLAISVQSEGNEITVAGDITATNFLDGSTNVNANTIKVKADYADDLLAEGYATTEADANGLVKVSGPAIAKIGETYYATLDKAFEAAQNGNEVKILAAGTYALTTSGKNITITGAVDGVVFDNIGAMNMGGANVTFNNVTFNYATNSTYKGLQHSGNLTYNNCTINGQVFLYGESETFNNCIFSTTDSNNYNVWTYGAKEVDFNECIFNSAGKSVLIYAEGASIFNNVNVTKCTFNASSLVDGKAAIEMDSSLTAGINLTIDGETTVNNFGSGNVSGNSLWNNKKGNQGANNDITVIVDGVVVLAPTTVAKIGETTYNTLQGAITAAGTTTTQIEVVGSTTENINIAEGANITLAFAQDVTLNGYFAPFEGNLTINGGTINNTNSGASAIEINAGELNLNNVNIASARHAVRIDGTVTATIDGGEYTLTATSGTRHAVNVSGGAEVTITAGTFVGPKGTTMDSGSAVCVQAGAKVTIEGGDFSKGKNATLGVTGTMIVTGGTFDQDPSAYVTAPYVVIKKSDNEYNVIKGVAKIGETYYATLQEAIDNVANEETINLLVACAENVSIVQTEGVSFTIDGQIAENTKVQYTGTISINGNGGYNRTTETLTIKNIKFYNNVSNYGLTFINAKTNTQSHNVTIADCDFVEDYTVENNYAKGITVLEGNNWTVTGCTVNANFNIFIDYSGSSNKMMNKNLLVDKCNIKANQGVLLGRFSDGCKIAYTKFDCATLGIKVESHANSTADQVLSHTLENVEFTGKAINCGYNSDHPAHTHIFNIVGYVKSASELSFPDLTNAGGRLNFVLTTTDATLQAKGQNYLTVNVSEELAAQHYEVVYDVDTYKAVKEQNVKIERTGATFATIQEAIDAAKAGDEIVLLADITENVTVNKNLTIDGKAEGATAKTYTGNMIVKADLTIKNVNFDGKGYNGYAVETRGANYLTVEDCTAKNYGYGFIQLASGTALTTVKNVTVSNMNYGVKVDYSNAVVLENLNLDCAVAAVLNSNYGTKTITIKNSNLSILGTWTRNNTIKTTYVFEGANSVGEFKIDAAIDNFKLYDVNSTLTAPNEITVTTDVEGYSVKYEGGVYKVVANNVMIEGTGATFATIQEAIDAAQTGDVVVLLKDITLTEADCVAGADRKVLVDVVNKNIILDMNEKKISVTHKDEFTDDYIVAVIRVADGAGLTVTGNGTIEVNVLAGNPDIAYMFWKRGTTGHLTIENGTFHMNDAADSMVYTNGDEIITVKGGTFTLDAVGTGENGSPWIFNCQGTGGKNVIVTGGTYNADINRQHWSDEVFVPETHYTANNGDGTYTIKEGAEAYVNTGMLTGPYYYRKNIGYATFEEAVKAAVDFKDSPVGLNEDVTLEETVIINGNGDEMELVIDLNEHTITGTATAEPTAFRIQNNANVIVKNGNINTENYNFILGSSDATTAGNLTIESGKFHGTTSVVSVTKGHLNITGGEFSVEPYQGNYAYLINCIDANYNNETATVAISGGTFHNWNPQNNAAEGAGTSFCAPGYGAISNGNGTWTVVEAKDVALVRNNETIEQFASLQAAIDKAQTGDVIVLLKDITLTEADLVTVNGSSHKVLVKVDGKDITLNMQNHKITVNHQNEYTNNGNLIVAVICVEDGAGLTVTGEGTIDVTTHSVNPNIAYMFWKRGTTGHLTIDNGTFHMNDAADSMVYTNGDEIITVKGGTFTLDAVGTGENGSPWIFNCQGTGGKNVIVTGGTFNADINRQHWSDEVFVPETHYTANNGDGTYTIKEGAEAYVNTGMLTGPYYYRKNIGYATFEEAVKAAVDFKDSPVGLNEDVTLEETVIINGNGDEMELVIDLNEHTITGTATAEPTAFRIQNNANVIVKNGNINTENYNFILGASDATSAGNLTIESGNYKGASSVVSVTNGLLTINGGEFEANESDWGSQYLINCIDSYNINGSGIALVSITGGKFHGFNPEDNTAENPQVNFCAPGYGAVETEAGSNIWEVMPVQEQYLGHGFNWYSSYLDITTDNLLSALGKSGKTVVLNGSWSATYFEGYGWDYNTHELDFSKMYMIETKQEHTLKLTGELLNAGNINIKIEKGWNWIGYPSNEKVEINTALKNLQATEGDRIVGQGGFADYAPIYGGWVGSLKHLEPTKGYQYNSKNVSEDGVKFNYNIAPATTRGNNETVVATHYSVDYTKYPFNMTMVAVVDGAMDDNYEVAALVNGEVRGSARPVYIDVLDAYMLFLTISGDNVEEVSFKYYDLTTGEEYDLVNRIDYSNNAMVGSVNEPYVLSRGTTGIGDAAMSQVNIYPNPTTTGTEINLQTVCDTVEVFNALGVKVAEYQNVDSIDALETAGIYVIRITNDGNVQNCRLVVK